MVYQILTDNRYYPDRIISQTYSQPREFVEIARPFFFCSRSNFRAVTRLETLATQASYMTKNNLELVTSTSKDAFQQGVADVSMYLCVLSLEKWRWLQKAWISDDYLGSFLLSQARLQTQSWLTVIGGPSSTTENAITDCPRLKAEFVLLGRVELPHEIQKIVSWCVCVCVFCFFFSVFPKIACFIFDTDTHSLYITSRLPMDVTNTLSYSVSHIVATAVDTAPISICHISRHRVSWPLFCRY